MSQYKAMYSVKNYYHITLLQLNHLFSEHSTFEELIFVYIPHANNNLKNSFTLF